METTKEILQGCLDKLKSMTPEEVQKRSNDLGIVIPNSPTKVEFLIHSKEFIEANRSDAIDYLL